MKDKIGLPNIIEKDKVQRDTSLLQKYDLPIQHLDFDYIDKSNNVKELERILTVLRSGEEGHFPHLTSHAEERIRVLDPKNRILLVVTPVLRSEYLERSQQKEIQNELTDWISQIGKDVDGKGRDIFAKPESNDHGDPFEIPIRGQGPSEVVLEGRAEGDDGNLAKKKKSVRIKAWEYDKWDKLDVDAELTRLDVTDMQISEWEKYGKPRVNQEMNKVEQLMKERDIKENSEIIINPGNKAVSSTQSSLRKKSPKPWTTIKSGAEQERSHLRPEEPSIIQEIPGPSSTHQTSNLKKKVSNNPPNPTNASQRRVKIMIEDVHIGF